MKLEFRRRVGKKRVIVIPKRIADELGLREGMEVKISLTKDGILVKPVLDAITLSLKGKKIAKITLKELEKDSILF